MITRKRLGLLLVGASLWAGAAAPTYASDSGAVDAQVTVATPCVRIVSSPSLDFGTLPFSTELASGSAQRLITYENCAEAQERIWGQGSNAQGTGVAWNLTDDQVGGPCTHSPNTYWIGLTGAGAGGNLGLTAHELESLAGGGSTQVAAYLVMPCVGSAGAGQTMSFQILFTATF